MKTRRFKMPPERIRVLTSIRETAQESLAPPEAMAVTVYATKLLVDGDNETKALDLLAHFEEQTHESI